MTHIHEKYPHGGWHYVVVKNEDGEAKFLHSIQVPRKLFFSTNYFYYRISENRSRPFAGMEVATSRISKGWYADSSSVGHIAIPNRVSLRRGFGIMKEITGISFTIDDLLGSFHRKCRALPFSLCDYRGETITKSQFETYKLLTTLPVLSPNVW